MKFPRRLCASWGLALALLSPGCGNLSPPNPRTAYLTDASFRRAELEASLTNPSNGYSQLRLGKYATHSGWDSLPEWNPRAEPILAPELGRAVALTAGALPLNLPADVSSDLRSLGEAAFFRYPVQLSPEAASLVTSSAAATRYGFWLDSDHGVGGLVRVSLANGRLGVAYSCATCHAAIRDGRLVVGLGNEKLNLGRLALDAHPGGDSQLTDRLARWGPGRFDVSSRNGSEPVRFPDLRATRLQGYLQADATVAQRDLVTLAIRLETLIITAHGEFIRPPRQVTLALAEYLWSLSESVEGRPPRSEAERRGAAIFGPTCAGCHTPPSFTGPPVSLASVGTDETLGDSPDRGTGLYRVPSLRGVSARGLLFHDGALPSLPALLDPARLEPEFAGGVRPGPVQGHPFGLGLSGDDRADLIAYLETL